MVEGDHNLQPYRTRSGTSLLKRRPRTLVHRVCDLVHDRSAAVVHGGDAACERYRDLGNNSRSAGFRYYQFVWWIGIGHAGTLISAILLLLNQSGAPRSTVCRARLCSPSPAQPCFRCCIQDVRGAAYCFSLSQHDGDLAAVRSPLIWMFSRFRRMRPSRFVLVCRAIPISRRFATVQRINTLSYFTAYSRGDGAGRHATGIGMR